MNINVSHIAGRVTREPEVKVTPNGMKVCTLSIATNHVYKNQAGQKTEEVEFHNIVSFGKTAETIAQYVKKGQVLYVEGRLKTDSWEDKTTGKKMYKTSIICSNFQFGERARNENGTTPAEKTKTDDDGSFDELANDLSSGDINLDDIPF